MATGKAIEPPKNFEWLNKSQLHVLTRITPTVIKRVMEQNDDTIPTKQPNAKTMDYKAKHALEALYKDKFGITNTAGDSTDGNLDEKQERAKLNAEQRRNAEIKNEILLKKLIRAEDLEPHWADIIAKVKAKLMALPVRVATECAGIEEVKVLEAAAKAVVYEALEELSADMMPEIDYDTLTESTE
ncbi:MAG: hypothetical protein V3R25_09735 [Nitrosomonadaceae bacterium]